MSDIERHALIKALFEQVCDLPEPERSARLIASGAAADIVARVQALLRREGDDTLQVARPIARLLGSLAGGESLAAGDRLGAWTLLDTLGEGGMGTVFRARRSDGHFDQTAAIKVLRGMPSPAALDFLARERQILASLAHPNIGRLLDGGATPQGQPYLVMEYIDGVPINHYCVVNALSIAAILRLLIQIGDAVSFAHARLVVHCDLKPSNILVDSSGRPWLLDFGIARLLGNDLVDGRPSSVSQRARAFTPGFASPEQESGGSVSTVSDVYSLGRLLQDLVGEARLAKDPELRVIVSCATQTDPAARYSSAAAWSKDLHNYLQHQPLQARPPSLAYSSGRLLRRRWPVVLALALFALTVLAFTLQLVADRDRALNAEASALAERDRATQAQVASKQISAFLVSMLDGANPDAGTGEIPTSKLVEQALLRIDGELQGQPAVQAELYGVLAGVQGVLGNPKLAQGSFEKAIKLERTLQRPLVLAELLGELARLRRRSASIGDAEAPARESLALAEANAPANSLELAVATQTLGAILSDVSGKAEEAEGLLRKALVRAETADPAGLTVVHVLAELAGQQTAAGDLPEAEQLLRRALALAQAHPQGAAEALGVSEQLGAVLGKQQKFDDAERMLRDALQQRRALNGDDDVSIPWRLSELANVLTNGGKSLEALPLFREALQVAAPKMGETSVPYAVLLNNLAIASMRVGDYAGAERAFRQALEILGKAWGARDPGLAKLRFNLATLLSKTNPAAAKPLLLASEAVFAAARGADHPDVIATRVMGAVIDAKLARPRAARVWLKQVEAAKAELPPLQRADWLYAQALVESAEGNTSAALATLERAETLREQALGSADPRVWLAKIERAELLIEHGSADDRANTAALAAEILTHLDTTLVADSPVRARLARLR